MKSYTIEQTKSIKVGRPTNTTRVLVGMIWFYVLIHFRYENYLPFAIFHFVISLIWFWFYEFHYDVYEKYTMGWYIPATLDVLIVAFFVYLTGTFYSSVVMGFILIVTLSSVDEDRKKGLFVVFLITFIFFTLIVAVNLDIMPIINILSNQLLEKNLFKSILTLILLFLCCITTNTVIFTVYNELNKKNIELAKTLEEVRSLKYQQDGDYFLTSLLLEPLGVNAAISKNIEIEFYTKQKKQFQFKKYQSEIGGDISISETISLQDKLYVIFFNGDAMGKSMQGAEGALVVGAAIKAIITRTQIQKLENQSHPEEWLKNCFIELQKIFETFDGTMLISGVIGLIEDQTGDIYYVNAEHPFPILYREGKASFLDNTTSIWKIGTPDFMDNFSIKYFKLQNNDIIILGSDGKDDLAFESSVGKVIDSDEERFLTIVEETRGQIHSIAKILPQYGELIDDLSLVKIQFKIN